MIEITALQFSIICAFIGFIVWLIRLEGKISQEIALRLQRDSFEVERDKGHNGRITNLEGRILDELRKMGDDIKHLSNKLDTKQDKE